MDKCAQMEARGGGDGVIRNQDVRDNVARVVQLETGGSADAEDTDDSAQAAAPSAATSAANGDAQSMPVDIRVCLKCLRWIDIFVVGHSIEMYFLCIQYVSLPPEVNLSKPPPSTRNECRPRLRNPEKNEVNVIPYD